MVRTESNHTKRRRRSAESGRRLDQASIHFFTPDVLHMNRLSASLSVLAALLLTACGGGGGGGSGGSPSFQSPPESREFPVSYELPKYYSRGYHGVAPGFDRRDVRHMPVLTDAGDALTVGIHSDAGDSLPRAGSRGKTDLRYGTRDDGTNREFLVQFIERLYDDRGGAVRRFESSPLIRVVGPSTGAERDDVIQAVQVLNAALPNDWQLDVAFSPDRPRPPHGQHTIAVGEITMSIYEVREAPAGSAGGMATTDPNAGDGQVWLLRGTRGIPPINVIAHEIMHALTGAGHPNEAADLYDSHGVRSIMDGNLMFTIDREFLRVLHTRLDNGDDPMDFGLWDDTATYIHGSTGHATFGVAIRGTPGNRYFELWGNGWDPDRLGFGGGYPGLRDNPALSGTVAWNGTLVGFTPGENSVVGDARISVNISSLSGQADLTGLEQWDAGRAPGSPGSGDMWGDGDLSYRLDIHGNRFRDGPGSADGGTLTGAFVGLNHEGVTGTLERSDLTAAFGASR